MGTTAEILVGASIAAAVLGLIAAVVNRVNSGFLKIPGFNALTIATSISHTSVR